jgi:hypothetical protein
MKSNDHVLLEACYAKVLNKQLIEHTYLNSGLSDFFSESVWNLNSEEAKLMFVEAYLLGQQTSPEKLEEGIFSDIGNAAVKPLKAVGDIYTSITKPIGDFVKRYGYEKTGLKEIDERVYQASINKFNSFIERLDPKAASYINGIIKEAQTLVQNNPIKMSLLSVALTTAMSFAGASTLAIFVAACLIRGTIGLLKGEKPLEAFGKSVLVGVIGKILGLIGKEAFNQISPLMRGDSAIYGSSIAIENPTTMKAFEIITGKPFSMETKEGHAILRIINKVFNAEGGSGGVNSKKILSVLKDKIDATGGVKALETVDAYSAEGNSTINAIINQVRQELQKVQGVDRNVIGTTAKLLGKDYGASKKMFDQLTQ